jgi:hypothetical protein
VIQYEEEIILLVIQLRKMTGTKPQAKRFRKGEHKEATKGSTLREQWLRGGGYFGSTLLRWGQLKDEQMGVLARYY